MGRLKNRHFFFVFALYGDEQRTINKEKEIYMLVKVIGWVALIIGILSIPLCGWMVIDGAFGTASRMFLTGVLCALSGWRLVKRKS
ncbi:MAG: hypothetical protein ACR2N3_12060 [Pyrinomonadaceae bacterium]